MFNLAAHARSFVDVLLTICLLSVSLGTFTLSNLGMFGVDRFDAILPPGTVSFFFIYIFSFQNQGHIWMM